MSCFDDKRFELNDGLHTLAYFYKDCKKKYNKNENENNNNNDHDNDNENDNDNDNKTS